MKRDTLTLQESIRSEAYLLSERAGHPVGMEGIFWLQAEAIVLGAPVANSKNGHKETEAKKTAKRNPVQPRRKKLVR